MELMIAISLIAIFSGLTIASGVEQWKRERVNAMAIQLAGWLESARRSALKGTACSISISSGPVAETEIVAQTIDNADAEAVGNNNCLANTPLRVNENSSMRLSVSSSPTSTLNFTPRGSLKASATPVVITLTLSNGPSKCVEVSGLLGIIAVGSSDGTTCTTP